MTRLVGEKAGDAKPKKVEFGANHATTGEDWRFFSALYRCFFGKSPRAAEEVRAKKGESTVDIGIGG